MYLIFFFFSKVVFYLIYYNEAHDFMLLFILKEPNFGKFYFKLKFPNFILLNQTLHLTCINMIGLYITEQELKTM